MEAAADGDSRAAGAVLLGPAVQAHRVCTWLASRGAFCSGAAPVGADSSARKASSSLPASLMLVFLSQAWLRLYGYLPQSSRQMSTMRSAQIFSSALSEMQKFYGITVTGVLDEETKM